MYIVKAYEDDLDNNSWLPKIRDGWWECETLEEAKGIRKQVLDDYPSLFNVKIFKSEEVVIEDGLREFSIKKKDAEREVIMQLKALGFDGYKVINEDGVSKTLF